MSYFHIFSVCVYLTAYQAVTAFRANGAYTHAGIA